MVREDNDFLRDLEAVYRLSFHRYLRVAEGICGDLDLARDAVQDAFARAIRFRASFRGDGPLEGWLWKIVVNSARGVPRANETPGEQAGVALSVDGRCDGPVGELVARLPERQRLVLFLFYYADMEYAAIADTLEIAPGTVGATLSAARAALKSQLEEVRHG